MVAAGTLGSSIILERSGIGAKAVLDKAGIQTVIDLSGVGENYMGSVTISSTVLNQILTMAFRS